MKKIILISVSYAVTLVLGFGLGVYFLPILTQTASPEASVLKEMAQDATFTTTLSRDLRGNDFFHWGEGTMSISPEKVVHRGKLAPGPDYKLYLVNGFVEHEDEFLPVKPSARYIGDVKSFNGFVLDIPEDVNIEDYNTVIVWCEAFSEFITAAKYK